MSKSFKILSVASDPKTIKGEKYGFLTAVTYGAPSRSSGYNTCSSASPGCISSCLGRYAGRANIIKKGELSNVIRDTRIDRTKLYFEDRPKYMGMMVKELNALVRKALRDELIPVYRPNGSTDTPYERVPLVHEGVTYPNIMSLFPEMQMYDYTKVLKRALAFVRGEMPSNYHLTFSATEDNHDECLEVLRAGGNVAMVFDKVPLYYDGYEVINGDESDLRFNDKKNVIVGLKAKGKARNDNSGFVRRVA